MENATRILTPVPLAAARLRVDVDILRRHVIRGKVPGERRGARWFVDLAWLDREVARRQGRGENP